MGVGTKHPPISVKKVCIPGAACERLYLEALSLTNEFEFERVYCHVGTNLLDQLEEHEVVAEISDFLAGIKDIFNCPVTFSPILPRLRPFDTRNPHLPISKLTVDILWSIRRINAALYIFCEQNRFDLLVCEPFVMDLADPCPDRALLALDGCHLSHKGVSMMQKSLYEHLGISFWEWHGN